MLPCKQLSSYLTIPLLSKPSSSVSYLPFSSVLCIDRLWNSASAGVVFRRPLSCVKGHLEGQRFGNTQEMTGVEDGLKTKNDRKRRKATAPVWLPKSMSASSTQVTCRTYTSSSAHPEAVESLSVLGAKSTNDASLGIEDFNEKVTSASTTYMPVEELNAGSLHQSESGDIPNSDIKRDDGMDASISTNPELVVKTDPISISIEVGSLVRFVKGKQGFTQRQIEEETGVKIIFPSSREDTCIVVESTSMDNVSKASEKIRNLLEEAAKSPSVDYSHFVSLPLAIHGELVEKLTMFQNSILAESDLRENDNPDTSSDEDHGDGTDNGNDHENAVNVSVDMKVLEDDQLVKVEPSEISPHKTSSDLGIDRSIFIKPRTFHLTVLMLKLYNKERLSLATDVLQKISSKLNDALDNRPIFIKLKGLACMRGSPKKASVVYAPVEEVGGEGRLSRACRVIIDAYLESGLILKEDAKRTLKLHATVMNVRHRKRNKKKVKKFDSFDARSIFEKYGSEEWGEYPIHEAHLSQRFKFDEYGYYHCCTSIPFPKGEMQV